MQDDDFETTMDSWAAHEIESAPEMRPTAEVYALVRARRAGRRAPTGHPRWAAGAALAGLLALVVLAALLFHPSRPVQQVALVGQREGFATAKGDIVPAPTAPPTRGEKGPPPIFQQLAFQYHKWDAAALVAVDLLAAPARRVALTSLDNYRLLLEPTHERHVYVFQLTSSGALARLFPSDVYSPDRNPLQPGQARYLPAETRWFHLDDLPGEERLYVLASAEPLDDLRALYDRYLQAGTTAGRDEILPTLLTRLEAIIDGRPAVGDAGAAGWIFAFDHE